MTLGKPSNGDRETSIIGGVAATGELMPVEPRRMRFALMDAGGELIAPDTYGEYSGIRNTNTTAVHSVSCQVLCDLEHWHEIGRTPLPPWTP